jgi:hypothetical protein
MLVGDAAGQVSPATGGGIKLAFELGRRAAQVIADHLMDLGPPPAHALAPSLPSFAVKKAMRTALDLAPPNWMIDAAFGLPPMRWLAQHVYFHRRNAARLRRRPDPTPPARRARRSRGPARGCRR